MAIVEVSFKSLAQELLDWEAPTFVKKSLPGGKFRVEDFSLSVSSQLAPVIFV